MGNYISLSQDDIQEMLAYLGMTSLDDLFVDIDTSIQQKAVLSQFEGKSELEIDAYLRALADQNHVFKTCLRGAGAYRHYIPAIVDSVCAKEDFVTAYTPYQAEISQGVLQSIFEYQTMIAELTGLDVSNASLYDGASATAEAITMCTDKKKRKALLLDTVHPDTIQTAQTYAFGGNYQIEIVPTNKKACVQDVEHLFTEDVSCLVVQSPNFYGLFEDVQALFECAKKHKVKCIHVVNPITLGLFASPKEMGADIAVGEGQPLGMPLSFGGPYLGFIATTKEMMRKLPGRIVGETVDKQNNRAFVLTLQAREQHIRREKASSNICSNQALCALRAAVYLSAVGAEGLKEVATLCFNKAHYFSHALQKLGFTLPHSGEFFNEFVTDEKVPFDTLQKALMEKDILCGLKIKEGILWCVTEVVTKNEMDKALQALQEVM